MNTNGMRVPMTARKNFSFKGTLIRAGKVFDAGHQDKARELYKAGDAIHGDASGDLSILAMQQPEAVTPRATYVAQQSTVRMIRTVNPEAPVEQVATDKSAEPVAPEGTAEPEFPVHTRPVVTEAESAEYDKTSINATESQTGTGASDAAAETAAVPEVKAADKVEEPIKQPETPVAAVATPSVKKVAARKR